MKRLEIIVLATAFLACTWACEEYPQTVDYPAPVPVSEIGKALVAGTDQISVIYEDESYTIHKGVEVTRMAYLSSEGRSMRTFWFKIDMTEPTVMLECITPFARGVPGGISEVLSEMLAHVDAPGHRVLGGTNSDFGGNAGPQGIYWSNGICVKPNFIAVENRPRYFVYITENRKIGIGSEAEYKDVLAAEGGSFFQAFCGSPRLMAEGKIAVDDPNDLDGAAHPRTAIGIADGGKTVYLMVVDGRRYTYSNGMYLNTLAECFLALGCSEALNLDGGGSSTFIVDGKVLNWPNDNGGAERLLWNGLAIIATDKD